jgi:hypothetical protein
VHVNNERLREWRRLFGESDLPVSQTPLLYPVTTDEQGAITALSADHPKLVELNSRVAIGYLEDQARKNGLVAWGTTEADSWSEVVLQGPFLGVANAFAKKPNIPCKTHRDYSPYDLLNLPRSAVPRTNYHRATDEKTFVNAQESWGAWGPYTTRYRVAWRDMIPFDTERSLFAALVPPGAAHVHAVRSMHVQDNRVTSLVSGFWAALPSDYLLRITGRAHMSVAEVAKMPAPTSSHPLAEALLVRTLRLNCLTDAYQDLWQELFHLTWPHYEGWAHEWPHLEPLSQHLTPVWELATPLRSEYSRRAALVELDALVAVWLGITADQLVAIYRSRYPVLSDYELEMYFDMNGRKIARAHHAQGYGQSSDAYSLLLNHLANPTTPPPEGYTAPFYKADREAEMRAAHAHFQARLDTEIAAGRWSPPEPAPADA